MKAWQITQPTGPEGLQLNDIPTPVPGPGEVLVRVRAVSLNYRDLGTTRRERPGNLPFPFTICSDGAGEVAGTGEEVGRWKVGDKVIPTFFQGWQTGGMTRQIMGTALGGARPGVLAEYVVVREDGLVEMPEDLSFEEAATLPCAGVTAWNALMEGPSPLEPDHTVLTLGTGGVSIFALQFAKALGATVIITSSSDEKLERAKELGADHVINYKSKPDWEREVHALTGKKGVDCVVEVGGAGTLQKSLDAVRYGGRISLIGVLSGFEGQINPWPIIAKSVVIRGIYVGNSTYFEEMLSCMASHRIGPVIDRVFEFSEGKRAFEHMASGAHFGKIVLTF